MKFRKLTALLLSAAMCAGLLAGCDGDGGQTGGNSDQPSSSGQQSGGGISGGLVPAILISIPGTPSSVCTTFDGHPMALRGESERALKSGGRRVHRGQLHAGADHQGL